MISNQVLQTTLDGMKAISRVDLCVLDTESVMLATTFPEAENFRDSVLGFVNSPADSQVVSGCQFFKVFDDHQLEYVLLANGNSDDVYMVGRMAAFQIQNLLVAYKERFDKDNFIKNLLLDNLLLVDIYNRAKKLHIDTEVRRVVFIVETNHEKEGVSLENIRSLFGSRSGDFITAVDEKSIIVVKELGEQDEYSDMDRTAEMILDALGEEKKKDALVAYGTIVNEIKEVSRSY
ncbi:MAG: PucR family transcriptional regulator, partial [Lachnospiraceae bacterium]|nr:PucR family transcriptional regulator [Lachnospiraceae bacterium]